MEILLFAARSLLVAGITLLLLKLTQRRSAADRSWIAHLGLAALLLIPLGAFVPALEVARPAFLETPAAKAATPSAAGESHVVIKSSGVTLAADPGRRATPDSVGSIDWAFWGYAAPAALLLLLTIVALLRLVALKARANVLVDVHWLKALAQAQQRMGIKSGTALLTSSDVKSPISWGLMRPVILLDPAAAKAHDEAEAIIAHELAHIARLDWAKLMLARVAVALFWFNPLVWLLAREAHQLREEAADDAVLRADVEDTDYANLLVGIARHESRGLLLGAHGVAPGKGSLARRVRRVLDSALERAPGGWRWSAAIGFMALGAAMPVAAFQFAATPSADLPAPSRSVTLSAAVPSAVAGAVTAAHQADPDMSDGNWDPHAEADMAGEAEGHVGRVGPGVRLAMNHEPGRPKSAIDRAIELKAVGATPEYVASIRRAAPHLQLGHDDIVAFAAMGVTPAYLGELASGGYSRLSADDVAGARSLGVDGAYIREMSAAGYGQIALDDLMGMKAVGVTAADVARYRRAAGRMPTIDEVTGMKAVGLTPEDLEAADEGR